MSEKNKNVLKTYLDYVSIVCEGYVIQKLENNLVHIESVKKSKILEGIIMKKKNLATAMAAAMTLGTVAPVVANAETPAAPVQLDARLASGYTVDTTVKKEQTYTILMEHKYRTDDTLKTAFKDVKIIAEKQDKENSYE